MVSSKATTVAKYFASLPPDRREAMTRVAAVVRKHLPRGYEEGMLYGMMAWLIPLERYPDTYNGQPIAIGGLASQKQYMSLYVMAPYQDRSIAKWFFAAYEKTGKKLDMGKSCIRFRRADDLALDVIGELMTKVSPAQLMAHHDKVHPRPAKTTKKTSKPVKRAGRAG